MNIQAVIADTQRGIAEVQGKIDNLLVDDADWRSLVGQNSRHPAQLNLAASRYQSAGREGPVDRCESSRGGEGKPGK